MAELISPMRRVATVLLTFACGCAISVALWMWWSDRCGEACPSSNVVRMLAFLGLLPTLGTMTSVLMVSTDWPRRVKLGLAAVLMLLAAGAGFFLSQLP
jgi:MFS family permease